MILPGTPLRLTSTHRAKLGDRICSGPLLDLEDMHRSYFTKDIPTWWKWHAAEPLIRGQKNFPFVGASNVVVPVIQIHSDATISRLYTSTFPAGDRIFHATTEDHELRSRAKNLARHANWSARFDYDYKMAVYDALSSMVPLGRAVFAYGWRVENKQLFFGPNSTEWIQMRRGFFLDTVPLEQILYDTDYEIQDAPVVARERHFTNAELASLVAQEKEVKKNDSTFKRTWIEEEIEAIKSSTGLESSISYAAGEAKRAIDNKGSSSQRKLEPHDIREVFIDWAVLAGLGLEDETVDDSGVPNTGGVLQIHLHRKTKRIIRAVGMPYHLMGKPFRDIKFRKDSGRNFSTGLCKKLETAQRIESVLFNQSIDSRTRANAMWGKTKDPNYKDFRVNPSQPIYDPTGTFEPIDVGTNVLQDMNLFDRANILAERLSGISDPGFGRETRQGGHPSPATSTIALLGESEKLAAASLDLIHKSLSGIGQDWAMLTQQFETNRDGKLQRVFGASDASQIEELLFPIGPIPLHYTVGLAVNSSDNNPQQQLQNATILSQLAQSFFNDALRTVLSAIQIQTQAPPELAKPYVALAAQYIDARKAAYEHALEATNVDDLERFLGEARNTGPDADALQLGRVAGIANELGAANGAANPGGGGGLPFDLAPGAGAANGSVPPGF